MDQVKDATSPEEVRKEKLKLYFQTQFNDLICMVRSIGSVLFNSFQAVNSICFKPQGFQKNLAAAEALLDCQNCSEARLNASGEDFITACGITSLFNEAAQSGSYSQVICL